MMKAFHYLLVVCFLCICSCEEVVTIDTGDLEERVIIEGQVINAPDQSFIKLTKSRDFYADGPADRITNAEVQIRIDESEVVSFLHNPENDPLMEGYYLPIGDFIGQIGSSYELQVTVEGVVYEAVEEMLPVTSIDSLTTKFNEDEFEEPDEEGRFFEVLLNAYEPQDRKDQYLFKFYRNDTLVQNFPTDVYVIDDLILSDRIDDLTIAGFYAIGESAEVEMYSLTPEAFVFYSDLANLLNGDGGMFSPPPANPRNNLSNGALGYFQVSALATEQIIVFDPRQD